MSFTAKSVIFDIANNWGGTYLGLRSVEFKLGGSLISLANTDYTVYSTSAPLSATYAVENIFDTSLSKTGGWASTSWLTDKITNQRVIVVFNNPITFDSIVVNNVHSIGGSTNSGAQNVKIAITEDTYTNTAYGFLISNYTKIFNGVFTEHAASDTVDDQILSISSLPVSTDDTYTAKSVIIDIADGYGGSYIGFRSIEFIYDGMPYYLDPASDFSCLSTGNLGASYVEANSVDSSKSKIGAFTGTQWLGPNGNTTNLRFIINFTTAVTFQGITFYNSHSSGASTTTGVKTIKITASTAEHSDLTYGAAISAGTVVFDGVVSQHTTVNEEDPQVLTLLKPPTPVVLPTFTAKSVVFDIYNNWGDPSYTGTRAIEFYKEGVKLALTQADYAAYASAIRNADHNPKYLFDTTTSKIDGAATNGWSASGQGSDRVIVVFNDLQTFDSIVVNNYHTNGTETDRGAKEVKIYYTADEYTTTTFEATVTNSTMIFDGQFSEHITSNAIDDFTIALLPSNVLRGTVATSSECTASSQYSATYSPDHAWDGKADDVSWRSDASGAQLTGSCWIQWTFSQVCALNKLRMAASYGDTDSQFPENIGVFGSGTGAFAGEEVHIGDFTLSQPAGPGEWCNWVDLQNADEYLAYRVEIYTQQNVPGLGASTWVAIEEVEFGIYAAPSSTKTFSGVVNENGSPVERTVRLYDRATGELLDTQTSDPTTGAFTLSGDTTEAFIVAFDDDAGDAYNALIFDRVIPT